MADIIVRSEPGFSPSLNAEIVDTANDYSITILVATTAVDRAWDPEMGSPQRTFSACQSGIEIEMPIADTPKRRDKGTSGLICAIDTGIVAMILDLHL